MIDCMRNFSNCSNPKPNEYLLCTALRLSQRVGHSPTNLDSNVARRSLAI